MLPIRRLLDWFDAHVKSNPDQVLLEYGGSVLTYGQADTKINQILNGLDQLGLSHSDRVALISRNGPDAVLCLLAAIRGGPILVPINHRLAGPEIAWQLMDARCVAIIAETQFIDLVPKGSVESLARFEIGTPRAGWMCFRTWFDEQNGAAKSRARDMGAPYLQIYTSGTTGRAKGVVLSEANAVAAISAALEASDAPLEPGQCIYQGFPLFHVGGVFVTMWMLSKGLSLVVRPDFDPALVDGMLKSGRIHYAAMVPAMIQACLVVKSTSNSASALRGIFYGASPVSEAVLTSAKARYHCGFIQVYGMTETHSLISMLTMADHRAALEDGRGELFRSAGRPVPGISLRISDPSTGDSVGPLEIGEISVRGLQITQGYWQRPDATEEAIRGGEMFTGDAGYLDDQGYLFIVDRLKDIIVSGGENVSSKEVEDVLLSCAGVRDAAVIGIPDDRWGESVKAVIVPSEGSLSINTVIAHCRARLAGFKVPKSVDLVDVIPRNGAGKILKGVLREPYWKGVNRRVS